MKTFNVDDERCEARSPADTPHSIEAKKVSPVLRAHNYKTRCALPLGHNGWHIGPDESTWEEIGRQNEPT